MIKISFSSSEHLLVIKSIPQERRQNYNVVCVNHFVDVYDIFGDLLCQKESQVFRFTATSSSSSGSSSWKHSLHDEAGPCDALRAGHCGSSDWKSVQTQSGGKMVSLRL